MLTFPLMMNMGFAAGSGGAAAGPDATFMVLLGVGHLLPLLVMLLG